MSVDTKPVVLFQEIVQDANGAGGDVSTVEILLADESDILTGRIEREICDGPCIEGEAGNFLFRFVPDQDLRPDNRHEIVVMWCDRDAYFLFTTEPAPSDTGDAGDTGPADTGAQ